MPAAEALREPTIAIIGRVKASMLPRTASSGGASSMVGEPIRIGVPRRSPMNCAPSRCARLNLALGVGARANADGARRTAAARKVGQGIERRTARCRSAARGI